MVKLSVDNDVTRVIHKNIHTLSGLPNFLRAMAARLRALENKNSMVS